MGTERPAGPRKVRWRRPQNKGGGAEGRAGWRRGPRRDRNKRLLDGYSNRAAALLDKSLSTAGSSRGCWLTLAVKALEHRHRGHRAWCVKRGTGAWVPAL